MRPDIKVLRFQATSGKYLNTRIITLNILYSLLYIVFNTYEIVFYQSQFALLQNNNYNLIIVFKRFKYCALH